METRNSKPQKDVDGTYEITPRDTMTLVCGEGVSYRSESHQVWGPKNDPPRDPDLSTREGRL